MGDMQIGARFDSVCLVTCENAQSKNLFGGSSAWPNLYDIQTKIGLLGLTEAIKCDLIEVDRRAMPHHR